MNVSETLEQMGDLGSAIADDQILGTGAPDYFYKGMMPGSSTDSSVIDDFEYSGLTNPYRFSDLNPSRGSYDPSSSAASSSSRKVASPQALRHDMVSGSTASSGGGGSAGAGGAGGSGHFFHNPSQQQQHQQHQQHQQQHQHQQQQHQQQQHQQQQQHDAALSRLPHNSMHHDYLVAMPQMSNGASMHDPKDTNGNIKFDPPFRIDLAMVRRTLEGVNRALGVDLGGIEVGESALVDNPLGNDSHEEGGDIKDGSGSSGGSSKAEMSHVRLISDACGHIVASVGRAVLQAAEDSLRENSLAGIHGQRPKPPIRKKRGGILGFKELARRANLSPWHFHRVFRFVTGVTPKAYGEALWEYLMVEAGFDLENEELTIDLSAAKPLDPAARLATPTSAGSSPSSPYNYGSGNSSRPLADGAAAGSGVGATSSTTKHVQDGSSTASPSTSESLDTAVSTASSNTSIGSGKMDAPYPGVQQIIPLSGPIAPGRVRKASSSRGARSRSRNRSQPQSQVLNALSLEPGSENHVAAGPLNRGRSFSRVAQRPVLITDQALQGAIPTPQSIHSPSSSAGLSPQAMGSALAPPSSSSSHSPSPNDTPLASAAVPLPTQSPKTNGVPPADMLIQNNILTGMRAPAGTAGPSAMDGLSQDFRSQQELMMAMPPPPPPQPQHPQQHAQQQHGTHAQQQQQQQQQQQLPTSFGEYGFDVPDMNALSLAPEMHSSVLDGSHSSSVPSVPSLAYASYAGNGAPTTQQQQQQQQQQSSLYSQQEPASHTIWRHNNVSKSHRRRQSTGAAEQRRSVANFRVNTPYDSVMMPAQSYTGTLSSLETNGNLYTSSESQQHQQHGMGHNRSSSDIGPHLYRYGDHIQHLNHQHHQQQQPSHQFQQQAHQYQDSATPTGNGSRTISGDSLQEDLQREMYGERSNEEAKEDQLGDLPTSFYLSMDDKLDFDGDSSSQGVDDFSSALIGMDDPPLMPTWAEGDTHDQYSY